MSDENERSVASDGSVEPAAWEVYWEGAARVPYLVSAKEKPSDQCVPPPRCVPLYRSPALTDEERKAIKDAIDYCEDIAFGGAADQEAADVLKALLERTK